MTLIISLSDEVEQRLKREALLRGIAPAEYAQQLLEQHLPAAGGGQPDTASLEILEKWEAENAARTPEELAAHEREGEEFMRQLARNRRDMEGPDARDLWP